MISPIWKNSLPFYESSKHFNFTIRGVINVSCLTQLFRHFHPITTKGADYAHHIGFVSPKKPCDYTSAVIDVLNNCSLLMLWSYISGYTVKELPRLKKSLLKSKLEEPLNICSLLKNCKSIWRIEWKLAPSCVSCVCRTLPANLMQSN